METPIESARDVYFLPNEVILLVEHEQLTQDEIAAQAQHFLDSTNQANPTWKALGARIESKRVLTFDHDLAAGSGKYDRAAQQRKARFLPPRDVGSFWDSAEQRRPQRAAFSLVVVGLQPTGAKQQRRQEIVELVSSVNTGLGLNPREADRLWIHGLTPNWLATPNPDNGGGSGPGGWPRPYSGALSPGYTFDLLAAPGLDGQDARPIDVAILDSAPSRDALATAYQQWGAHHPLLAALVGPDGVAGPTKTLDIIYADALGVAASLPDPEAIYVKHHDYTMTDHGLFAAGIIASIAPHARIRLLQVLNDKGVGSLESIGGGLLWLLKQHTPDMPLIVNMSLMLGIPLKGHSTSDLCEEWPLFGSAARLADPAFKQLAWPIEWICAALRSQNVTLVASAGNDGDDADAKKTQAHEAQDGAAQHFRPQARYPAAFTTVLGVGALEEGNDQPTQYSNISDQPDGAGIATFGGQKNSVSDDAEVKTGMLGVYIGDFPVHTPADSPVNKNGWAWWAGTSFAAPIISGTLAALAGQGGSLADAELQLDQLVQAPTAENIGGVFPVAQP